MNIIATNYSLDNIIIRQGKEKKRPSFASVFEKLNKRSANMNRMTPMNNILTNEQLFRYYLKETDPKLRVSDDVEEEDDLKKTLNDYITNKSLKMTTQNQNKTTQADIIDVGDDGYNDIDVGDDGYNDPEIFNLLETTQPEIENRIITQDERFFNQGQDLNDFLYNLRLEKDFSIADNFQFNERDSILRHGTDIVSRIGQQAYNLGLNSGIDTSDFLSNIVKDTVKKSESLQESLREAGIDFRVIPYSYLESPAKSGKKDLFLENIDKNHPETNYNASTAIQSVYKGHLARKKTEEKRIMNYADNTIALSKESEETKESKPKRGRPVGSWGAKRRELIEEEGIMKKGASTHLQAVYKGHLARNKVKGLVIDEGKKSKASTAIQAVYKGHLARNKVKGLGTEAFV